MSGIVGEMLEPVFAAVFDVFPDLVPAAHDIAVIPDYTVAGLTDVVAQNY